MTEDIIQELIDKYNFLNMKFEIQADLINEFYKRIVNLEKALKVSSREPELGVKFEKTN